MYPGRFFIPTSPYTIPMKNPSFFSRLLGGVRGINWGSLLTNANKTLSVVNQTIPLIRQTGPMISNLRSMMQLARAFNSTAGRTTGQLSPSKNLINNNQKTHEQVLPETIQMSDSNYSESPSFFI